jgi:hypothetical protein
MTRHAPQKRTLQKRQEAAAARFTPPVLSSKPASPDEHPWNCHVSTCSVCQEDNRDAEQHIEMLRKCPQCRYTGRITYDKRGLADYPEDSEEASNAHYAHIRMT